MRETMPDGTERVACGQEQVAAVAMRHWQSLLNSASERPYDPAVLEKMLAPIAADAAHRVTSAQAANLTPEAMFTPARFIAAMKVLATDTSPGASGITTALARHAKWRELM